ncbi:MAG: hypothetical protein HUJ72_06160 [Blautia sp.]|nr:hypothetical protein [Blautia sp.]
MKPKITSHLLYSANSGTKWLRLALYVAALAMTLLGVLNGGMHDTLIKAVNICTECIGLG